MCKKCVRGTQKRSPQIAKIKAYIGHGFHHQKFAGFWGTLGGLDGGVKKPLNFNALLGMREEPVWLTPRLAGSG